MSKFIVLASLVVLLVCKHGASEQDIPSLETPNRVPLNPPKEVPISQPQPVPEIVPSPDIVPPRSNDANENTGLPFQGRTDHVYNNGLGNYPPIMIPMPGPAGPPGYPGPTGATGPAGMPGNHGNNGNNGPTGPAGANGAKGQKGEQGYPGVSGAQGIPGVEGSPGPRGQSGLDGTMGIIGHAGKHGLPGSLGPPGEQGFPGRDGPRGSRGDTGDPGVPGVPGRPGSNGECDCGATQRYGARTSAFSVARTTGLTATDGPLTVTFQHVFTNVGDDFDINTGKFNCSIPGLYFFTINVYKSSQTNFPLVQILLNGEHVAAVIDYGGADTEDSATNSVILSLGIGDMVWLQLYDGREIYSSHYRFTTFSGFRIG